MNNDSAPQISTRVDCLLIETNQANWTLKKYQKEPIFSTTHTALPRGKFAVGLKIKKIYFGA